MEMGMEIFTLNICILRYRYIRGGEGRGEGLNRTGTHNDEPLQIEIEYGHVIS